MRVVLGANIRPDSVWNTVEYPTLVANRNITCIIQVNPTTGAETIIFMR
jgi:hypothetical protein